MIPKYLCLSIEQTFAISKNFDIFIFESFEDMFETYSSWSSALHSLKFDIYSPCKKVKIVNQLLHFQYSKMTKKVKGFLACSINATQNIS